MAEMELDLPIKPFVRHEKSHTVVRLHLSYNKNQKGPVLYLQTGHAEPSTPSESGISFSGFSFFMVGSPNARHVVEQGWKMNNKKRMEAAWEQVKSEIAGKRGDSYEALQKLLAEAGTELVSLEAAAA